MAHLALNANSKFKQFYFNIDASMGYSGSQKTIRIMSGYEWKSVQFLIQLYKAKRIKSWSSEETVFQYKCMIDPPEKTRKYYMDFTVQMENGDIVFIEVKPYSQHAKAPQMKGRKKDSTYQHEVREWIVNQAKWSAVREFCLRESSEKQQYKFVIWDEYTLQIKSK